MRFQRSLLLVGVLAVQAFILPGRGWAQSPQIAGVSDAANFTSTTAPGGIISIFGSGLATGEVSAPSLPLPTYLNGASVYIDGMAAPLLFVSPGQINAQIPYEIAANSTATVQVTVNGNNSANAQIAIAQSAPAIFTQAGTGSGLGLVTHSDYTLVTDASPALAGETLIVYATGLGAKSPAVQTGAGGAGQAVGVRPAVATGGLIATVAFAGAAPGFAGVDQLNVTIPALAAGHQTITIYLNGARSSTSVSIAVGQVAGQPVYVSPFYFGMHLAPQFFRGSLPWPSIPIGALRLMGDDVTWADLEPTLGTFDFSLLDSLIAGAHQYGVPDLIETLVKTPTWASTNPYDTACSDYLSRPGGCDPPSDLNSDGTGADQYWKDFVTAVVQHVCVPAPCSIQNWEIWNEPNAKNFWTGTPQQLVRLTQDASQIIKSINPNLTVISPPPAGAGDPSSTGDSYLQSFLQAGGGQYVDVIGFHGYLEPSNVTQPQLLVSGLTSLLQTRSNLALGSKPLWDTEGSWAKNANLPDPDMDAAFLATYYLLQATSVQRFYWYAYDYPEGELYDPASGQLDEAGVAYGQVYSWMVGAVPTAPCAANGSIYTCAFTRPGGYQALAIWDSSLTCSGGICQTSDFPIPSGFVQYRDLSGALTPVSSGQSIPVSVKPVLLENQNP